jgi:hypothetical protein
VYGSGYTFGAFPGFSNPGNVPYDYIVKYSPTGTQLWAQQFGTGAGDFLLTGTADAAGNTYVGGASYGAFPGFTVPTYFSAVVAKYSAAGAQQWVQEFSIGGYPTTVTAIAVDTSGNIYIGGAVTQGSATQTIYFAKLSGTNGAPIWTQQYGSVAINVAVSVGNIAVSSSGDVAATGLASGGFPGSPSITLQPYLVGLGPTGSVTWSGAGVPVGQYSYYGGLAYDSDGNVILGGQSSNSLVIIGWGASYTGRCLLSKYEGGTGALLWQQNFWSGQGDQISSVAVDPSNNVYAAGVTNGTYNSAFSQPSQNTFLLKFDTNGNNIWVQQFGNGGVTTGTDPFAPLVASDPSGNAILGTATQGAFSGYTNPAGAVQAVVVKYGP